MQDFKKLRVWKRAHALAVAVCGIAVDLPARYLRLADQLIGSSSSIPANLAEGCGRHTTRDQARFFDYAAGSTSELEALVLIAQDLHLLDERSADCLCREIQEIRAMIYALLTRLRRSLSNEARDSRTTARAQSTRTTSRPGTREKLKLKTEN